MKLETAQIERIHAQTGIQPIPDSEPSHDRLEEHFGDHTFYLDPLGLYIWETVEAPETAATEVMAIQIAAWTNDDMVYLQTHAPKETGKIVVLGMVH